MTNTGISLLNPGRQFISVSAAHFQLSMETLGFALLLLGFLLPEWGQQLYK